MKKPTTLKEALKKKLTKRQLSFLRTSYDVVGDIAIIEIPPELIKKEKLVAKTLLELSKNIKVVCKKAGTHKGKFRTQKLRILAGERRKTTLYKENNCVFKLNIETSYFSPRLATERLRIAHLIKPNESVLVMFAGVAPYPIVIAKNSKAKHIMGVELNPEAYEFALENIALNKLANIDFIWGDVKKVVPKLHKKFDRILMPLPKCAEDFIDTALHASKKGSIIHFYDFLHEDSFSLANEKIANACKKAKKHCKILKLTKCGQHAPRVYRICVDFQII
jgi:tRNA (guanine37-N1)-methyltransferase